MKILLFTENRYRGGMDSFIINLINSWPNKDDEFSIAVNKDHPGIEDLKDKIKSTKKIIEGNWPLIWHYSEAIYKSTGSKVFRKLVNFLFRYPLMLYQVLYFKTLFKKHNFDELIIVNGAYPGGDSCRSIGISWWLFKNKKSIHNFHNYAQKIRKLELIQERFIDFLLIKSTKKFITVSNSCAQSLRQRFGKHMSENIIFIYNGILDFENEHIVNERTFSQNGNAVCVMLGTYEERKGHKFLLDAFKIVVNKNPNTKLLIYGHGNKDETISILNMIEERNLSHNVELRPFDKNPRKLLLNADLLLLPSQRDESFGLTLIEAMSVKTPVIGTHVGGIPEVLGDNFKNYCINPDDFEELAAKILEIIGSNKLKKELGDQGFLRFKENFHANVMAQKYHDNLKVKGLL